MSTPGLGSKYVCASCTTKYYDLNRTPAVCPRCGVEAVVVKASKAAPAKRAARRAYRRFP